jgi:hypothetical protein
METLKSFALIAPPENSMVWQRTDVNEIAQPRQAAAKRGDFACMPGIG